MANNSPKASAPANLPTQGAGVGPQATGPNTNTAPAAKNIPSQSSATQASKPNIPVAGNQAPAGSNPANMDINKPASQTIPNQPASAAPQSAEMQPPVAPPPDLNGQKPGGMPLNDTTVESLEKRSRIIRLILLIASALIIVGLVVAGIYIYNNWLKNASIETPAVEEEQTQETQEEETIESDDRDDDSLPNEWEEANGLNPDDSSDAAKDSDFDGLNNLEEYQYQTDPKDSDTDRDGYSDGQEVEAGFNPAGSGKLNSEQAEESSNTAFLADSWMGTMKGSEYDFSDIEIALRSNGKISISYNIRYNEEIVTNEGLGDFEVEREINKFSSEVDMQGLADSGSGTYLFGINGTLSSNNNEISGTWFIIPSSLTAPWMLQDRGTFSWKRS